MFSGEGKGSMLADHGLGFMQVRRTRSWIEEAAEAVHVIFCDQRPFIFRGNPILSLSSSANGLIFGRVVS